MAVCGLLPLPGHEPPAGARPGLAAGAALGPRLGRLRLHLLLLLPPEPAHAAALRNIHPGQIVSHYPSEHFPCLLSRCHNKLSDLIVFLQRDRAELIKLRLCAVLSSLLQRNHQVDIKI